MIIYFSADTRRGGYTNSARRTAALLAVKSLNKLKKIKENLVGILQD